jgi:uncharacterized protein YjbI with pentapeptide repeats
MTETAYQFLDGCARTGREVRFYLKLHPCPQCGSRDFGEPKSTWGTRVFEDGSKHYAAWYRVMCPQCGHERKLHFLAEDGGEHRHSDFEREVEQRYGYELRSTSPTPVEVFRASRHLAAPPEPSTLIQPHEFATEFVRLEAARPADRTILDNAAWNRATDDVFDALTCVYELRKYFVEGVDEMPDHHVRTEAARIAREAHPEWFRRSWVEAQASHWEQLHSTIYTEGTFRASLPADDPRSHDYRRDERPPVLPPLSPASLLLHEKWLADEDGDRLHAKGIDATGKQLSGRDLSAAILEEVVLDRADLSFARLHGAVMTGVRARGASLASAMVAGTELTRCDFTGAAMPIAKLGDAEIADCDFSGADLERTTWYRSKVTRCTFAGATLTNGGFDKAVFTECDFRDANLGMIAPNLLGTAFETVFVRCDLRGTDWTGLELFRTRFVDCKLAGAHGTPSVAETVVERADLSPEGDGSLLGGLREVCRLWGIDPATVREPDGAQPSETEAAR